MLFKKKKTETSNDITERKYEAIWFYVFIRKMLLLSYQPLFTMFRDYTRLTTSLDTFK